METESPTFRPSRDSATWSAWACRGTGLATAFPGQPGVEVAYVSDADMARAERAAAAVQKARGRNPRAVQDYHRILEDKNVDAVVVATCNHWHAPATIEAVSAGKHVYVEKPCSHNPREGELMVQAARKHKKLVQMGNQRRSYPAVIQAMDELRKGVIGRTYLAQSWYQANRGTIGRGKPTDPPKFKRNMDIAASRVRFRLNLLGQA